MERAGRGRTREELTSLEAKGGGGREERIGDGAGRVDRATGETGLRGAERGKKRSQTFFDLVVHGEGVIGPHVGRNQDLSRVLQHLKVRREKDLTGKRGFELPMRGLICMKGQDNTHTHTHAQKC